MSAPNAEPESAHSPVKTVGLLLGLTVFAVMLMNEPPEGLPLNGWYVLAIMALMALWWMTEAIPVAVTALVPLVAVPFLGLGDTQDAAKGFASDVIYLTMGGFMLGVALERWNLHKRIALHTVRLVGTSPRQVIGGVMIATALISMWITNTATTVMMFPIALSVTTFLLEHGKGSAKDKRNFGLAMMIGIAYAASMGGMMTLVGTSTNVLFRGFVEQQLHITIGFGQWMMIGVPAGLAMLFVIWWGMTRVVFPCRMQQHAGVSKLITDELHELGRMRTPEKRMLGIFCVTATLWMFGAPLESLIGIPFNDTSIAVAAALALFLTPSGGKKGERLITWQEAKRIPWGILLLLGGGLSIASFMETTGVAEWIGHQTAALHGIPPWAMILIATAAIVCMTELMSNVATLTAFLPIIFPIAKSMGIDPLAIGIPLALSASCAFMLPVSTPPNAIVFGSGLVRIKDMVRAGITFNLIGIFLINALCALLIPLAF